MPNSRVKPAPVIGRVYLDCLWDAQFLGKTRPYRIPVCGVLPILNSPTISLIPRRGWLATENGERSQFISTRLEA